MQPLHEALLALCNLSVAGDPMAPIGDELVKHCFGVEAGYGSFFQALESAWISILQALSIISTRT